MADKPQVIKEVNSSLDSAKSSKKTVLLCTNGFQNADIHDATNMLEYFKQNFAAEFSNCEVMPVQLFHPADKKTHHAHLYEEILESAIKRYIDDGYDIVLMGYSFSASLAAKMQYKYSKHIQKLILVAPIYDTIVNGMINGYIQYVIKFHKLSKKYGPRVAKAMGRNTTKGMIGLLLSILKSILCCRGYYKKITCDTLILRGDKDELCNPHSIKKIRKHLRVKNALYRYPSMDHGMLKTIRDNKVAYEDILHFAFGTPFIAETDALAVVDKVKNEKMKIKYDVDGEPIPTFLEIFNQLDPDAEEERKQDQEAL